MTDDRRIDSELARLLEPDRLCEAVRDGVKDYLMEEGSLNEAWDELEAREMLLQSMLRDLKGRARKLGFFIGVGDAGLSANDNGDKI